MTYARFPLGRDRGHARRASVRWRKPAKARPHSSNGTSPATGEKWTSTTAGKTNCRLSSGFRLLSAYTLSNGTKLWIITEADRSATTLLLPSEY